jgi:hypothetical protein
MNPLKFEDQLRLPITPQLQDICLPKHDPVFGGLAVIIVLMHGIVLAVQNFRGFIAQTIFAIDAGISKDVHKYLDAS